MTNQHSFLLGQHLRSLRQATSATLRDVEGKTGISNAFLSQLESGKVKQPSPMTLFKLAQLYGVAYEMLMEKAGYPVPQGKSSNVKERGHVYGRLGPLTDDEERLLLEYLAFIRSRQEEKEQKK